MPRSDHIFYQGEGVLLVSLLSLYGLYLLVRRLRAGRPDLAIAAPVAAAVFMRVAAAVAISLTPIARQLRGGDELTFLHDAHEISSGSILSPASLTTLGSKLFIWVTAQELRLFQASDLALRLTQITFAVVGLTLLAVAVHDLAGPKAAVVAAWMLAVEPSNVFFSGLLHKEAQMMLAEGLVAFGGAQLWRGRRQAGVLWMLAGCTVGVTTRPYAGWFLIAATASIALHGALRRDPRARIQRRRTVLATTVVLLVALAIPVLWNAAPHQLERLQASQEANTTDTSNLKFEQVDYSTPTSIVLNLPKRITAFLLRPYPWELANIRQRLGLLGGVVVLVCLWLLGSALVRTRGRLFDRAGPLLYTVFFLLLAYSITSGNAGTAFRYRSHIIALAICVIAVTRQRRGAEQAQPGLSTGAEPLAMAPRGSRRDLGAPVTVAMVPHEH